MSKRSFGVRLPQKNLIILGVTSIMPNLNGVLIQTEILESYQVESYDMPLEMYVDYDDGIPEVDENVYDCREK